MFIGKVDKVYRGVRQGIQGRWTRYIEEVDEVYRGSERGI